MNNPVISLKHISKRYYLHSEKPTLMESLMSFNKKVEYWVLDDINLQLNQGEHLGILGINGAGKTTLLKIIAGITKQTSGTIDTRGRIVSLIELTAGFHPELNGIENIFLNGMLLGISKDNLHAKLDQIIDYAGIGSFIKQPLFTYSSGMSLRLGFSIAIHSDPDILIFDENLSTGDAEFEQKSLATLMSPKFQRKTIIFASHDLEMIRAMCEKTMILSQNKIISIGETKKVIRQYLNFI